ncbi:MAG: hypothetical protein A2X36_11460 [Elusimicrobia bacterium GWA2_69_24]|nr:MAG: hypothetical protein A2X36_11460 [Elusimicrobia bacterium GWA2_69_24]HBL16200.1 hypothetical protein [Elusimicrobiota bacterium]
MRLLRRCVPLALLALAACSGSRQAAAPSAPPSPPPGVALPAPAPTAVPAVPIPLTLPAVFAPVPVAAVELSSLTVFEVISAAPAPQELVLSTAPAPDVVLPPPVLPTPPVPVPADANLVLSVSEAISGSEEDVLSQTRVFIDGAAAGETHIGPKSAEKRWGLKLAPGNHLFRFEQWVFLPPLSWAPLGADWQPRERFIRVEGASRTVISLRFFDGDRRHSLQSSREPF